MNVYSEVNEKWRKQIMYTSFCLMFVILFVEIAVSVILYQSNLILQSISVYIWYYLSLPTIWNGVIVGCGFCLVFKSKLSERIKNYVPIFVLCLLCFSVAFIHNIFSSTSSSFCIPIFLTAIYGDKFLAKITMVFCEFLLFICLIASGTSKWTENAYYLPDSIIAMVIVFCAFLISIVLIRYEKEKNLALLNSLEKQSALEREILRDPLTGLFNHNTFWGYLERVIKQEKPHEICLAVIDIDDFKQINDTFGHVKGDDVLIVLSRIIEKNCSDSLPARYGGEEFAVIFPGHSIKEAEKVIETIRKEFEAVIFAELNFAQITFSCGIARYEVQQLAKEFFCKADDLMYLAKRRGKRQTVLSEAISK